MAAVLACGTDAVLSHGSAAALWGIGSEWRLIEVSVRHRTWSRLTGVKGRARPSLPAKDVTVRRRIPVTTVPRTILDQAATPISDASLERLVNEADVARGIDFDLPACSGATATFVPGEPGVRRLRRLLDPETFRLSDSELERLFRPLAIAAGFPQPLTKDHRQRLRGRLLLAGPRLGGRDRLAALSPQRDQAVARSPARSGAHRRWPDDPALYPLAGRPRAAARRGDPRRYSGLLALTRRL